MFWVYLENEDLELNVLVMTIILASDAYTKGSQVQGQHELLLSKFRVSLGYIVRLY